MSPEQAADEVLAEVIDQHEERLAGLERLNERLHPGYEDLDYLLDE